MELKRLVRNAEGNFESTWVFTQEQMAVLFWHAINDLLSKGMATVIDITPEDLEKLKQEAEGEYNEQLLSALNKDDLPQA